LPQVEADEAKVPLPELLVLLVAVFFLNFDLLSAALEESRVLHGRTDVSYLSRRPVLMQQCTMRACGNDVWHDFTPGSGSSWAPRHPCNPGSRSS